LLCLLVMAAEGEGGGDEAFLKSVQLLKADMPSNQAQKPAYVKAYFNTVTKKLEEDMKDLKLGLEAATSEAAARQLFGKAPVLAITG